MNHTSLTGSFVRLETLGRYTRDRFENLIAGNALAGYAIIGGLGVGRRRLVTVRAAGAGLDGLEAAR